MQLETKVDVQDWCVWAAAYNILADVIFFLSIRPELSYEFDPQSKETTFFSPVFWNFFTNIMRHRNALDPTLEPSPFETTGNGAAAVAPWAVLNLRNELSLSKVAIRNSQNAIMRNNASVPSALGAGPQVSQTPLNFRNTFLCNACPLGAHRHCRQASTHFFLRANAHDTLPLARQRMSFSQYLRLCSQLVGSCDIHVSSP